jgi:cobalt/nickel transport system ATP-binding protein
VDSSSIEVEGLCHAFAGNITTLDDIGFGLRPGESAVLLGANGTGKSTLLKILDALIAPARGTYRYGGEHVTPERLKESGFARRFRREVGLLFQNPDAMLFNPTVFDEIAFGPRQLGLTHIEERVRHWAGTVGIETPLDRPSFHLSGGEKQRICIAALLVLEPRVLLLDEPTANMDPRSTGWFIDFIQELPQTTLIATHNLSLAPELGDRTLVLGEDHRLLYDGPIDDFLRNMDALVAANLVHRHHHRHGDRVHSHFHLHDWD